MLQVRKSERACEMKRVPTRLTPNRIVCRSTQNPSSNLGKTKDSLRFEYSLVGWKYGKNRRSCENYQVGLRFSLHSSASYDLKLNRIRFRVETIEWKSCTVSILTVDKNQNKMHRPFWILGQNELDANKFFQIERHPTISKKRVRSWEI